MKILADVQLVDGSINPNEMAVSATDRLLGRDTAAAGNVEEIALAGSLQFTGSQSIQLAGDSTSPGNNYYYGTDGSGTKGFFQTAIASTQTGTTYSLAASDNGTEVKFTNAGTKTITVLATGTLGSDFIAVLNNLGAGAMSVVPDSGVTLRNDVADIAQYQLVTIRAIGTNEYQLTPSIVDSNSTRDSLGLGNVANVNLTPSVIYWIIDGGGSAITTGVKGYLPIPFACTITGWRLLADQSGSIVIDVWKDTYANYPPVVGDTIAGTEKPTLSSVIKNEDVSLSSWTTSIAAGDILGFNVDSASTVTRVTLQILVTRT